MCARVACLCVIAVAIATATLCNASSRVLQVGGLYSADYASDADWRIAAPSRTPELGQYKSGASETIAQHREWVEQAGLDFLLVRP